MRYKLKGTIIRYNVKKDTICVNGEADYKCGKWNVWMSKKADSNILTVNNTKNDVHSSDIKIVDMKGISPYMEIQLSPLLSNSDKFSLRSLIGNMIINKAKATFIIEITDKPHNRFKSKAKHKTKFLKLCNVIIEN